MTKMRSFDQLEYPLRYLARARTVAMPRRFMLPSRRLLSQDAEITIASTPDVRGEGETPYALTPDNVSFANVNVYSCVAPDRPSF